MQNTRFMQLTVDLSDEAIRILRTILDNTSDAPSIEEYTADMLTDIINNCWRELDSDQPKS